ncbi:cytochrome ubiquinol oxidase subunit I [Anaeromyxobacter paludicola]|uniref:Cytochrome c n=1 Tax=Anaeromyxobacter paludicola TaxID=2918171 RepID=A0ABM7XBG6_9BACT|nr:cytochrome ubiquinol oxidase subunit I [Anaeromyxobacter paludicola]BDG09195.1 cytochrome c [Anaeromyxobacter paludicola]
MNYPVWQLEMGGGLLIALVAVTHVFVSHFAVGGGLFLVMAERRAYRTQDAGLLDWLRRHARFFALLTLVFGAVSGVGIWFTIGLVHPAATSALIHVFVWGWAIEWVFFFVEIAAAVIYASTWDRLDRRTHLAVGWIYFVAAFMSLVVINGILAFMFTPGAWLDPATRSFWTGFFNPTYFPQLLVRTLAAVAFAGLYVFATAWRAPLAERPKLARYAALWALPATLAGPLAAVLYLQAAPGAKDLVFGTAIPGATHSFRMVIGCAVLYGLLLAAVALLARRRPGIVSLPTGVALLVLGYGSIAGAEFVRESIRKPYVIGNPQAGYLYVNGLTPADTARAQASGLLAEARWVKGKDGAPLAGAERGAEVFRVACRGCHSLAGYRPIRKYVDGKPVAAIATMVGRLDKLRGRMPPFPGAADEAHDLALYLGGLDGELEPQEPAPGGAKVADAKALLQDKCLACHDLDGKGSNPLRPKVKGWSAAVAYEKLGKLSQLNAGMMGMDVTDEAERKTLAGYLATLATEN